MPAELAAIRRIEEAALATWPALETRRDGAWVVRRAEGHTGRANSINVLDPADHADIERRLGVAEAFYREEELRPRLRQTPLTPPALTAFVEQAGWVRFGDSIVMARPLASDLAPFTGQPPAGSADRAWLEAMTGFMDFSAAKREAIGRKLERLESGAGFFSSGTSPACRSPRLLPRATRISSGCMRLASRPRCAAAGSVLRCVLKALGWARATGASLAFLQVTAENAPAIALYRQLGFTEAYRYSYRAAPREEDAA